MVTRISVEQPIMWLFSDSACRAASSPSAVVHIPTSASRRVGGGTIRAVSKPHRILGPSTMLWTEETAKNTNGVSLLSTNLLRPETKNPLVGRASSQSESKLRPATSQMPVPGTYGVYAVSDGNLMDLDLLPIRAPKSRIALSRAP